MIVKRHRVCNYLHTVIKTSVVFYVDTTFIYIRHICDLFRIFINMTSSVNFKFYAEVTFPFSIKDRIRLKTVIVNIFVRTSLIVAMTAVGVIGIIIKIAGFIILNSTTAGLAGCIVVVIAMLT